MIFDMSWLALLIWTEMNLMFNLSSNETVSAWAMSTNNRIPQSSDEYSAGSRAEFRPRPGRRSSARPIVAPKQNIQAFLEPSCTFHFWNKPSSNNWQVSSPLVTRADFIARLGVLVAP
jgi:hypothetical protein